MCGIAGFIDSSLSKDDAFSLMQRMLQSIAHRGPDNTTIKQFDEVALGHNRLTIIDLSDTANQPMTVGNLTIIFNGEMYNYIEVRKELEVKGYRFTTQSDTEVILAAYKEWSKDCVKRFVGMWAFALWDEEKKELFCSRDRFGIKPFLYIHEGGKFYFGSEYKPLKLSPAFTNDINEAQVKRGLQLGWVVYRDETYFKKIKALPEACNLIFSNGRVVIEKYWDIDLTKKLSYSFEERKAKFRELFLDSIRLHTRSDVEVGGCLSGGIDSSAITSAVGTLFPQLNFKTFSIYYEGENETDERPFINEVIDKYPHINNYAYSPKNDALMECFHRMSYHLDVPSNWSSDISQYYVMELASKYKMKVLLDGQGSDEFLGGYLHSFYRLIGDDLKHLKLSTALSMLNHHRKMRGYGAMKTADLLFKSGMSAMMSEQQLYGLEYNYFYPFLAKDGDKKPPFQLKKKSSDKLDNFLYHLAFNTLLPSLLHFEDRNSMAFSIESRVPFLDHRLVEFGFSLSDNDKINRGTTKYILRESMKDILPQGIYERRDKKGFTTPGEKWLKNEMSFLLEQDFSKLYMLDQKKIKEVIREYKNGNSKLAHLLWRVGGLNYWINNFV